MYAAVLKLASPAEFADSIAAYRILPDSVVNLVALGLPVFEFACCLLVITGLFSRVGILGILGLLAVFAVAMVNSLLKGLPVECGCFGPHSWLNSDPWIGLVRNGILGCIAACLYGCEIGRRQKTEDRGRLFRSG